MKLTKAQKELLRLFLLYGEGPIPQKILHSDVTANCDTETAYLLWNGWGSRYLVRKPSSSDLYISRNGLEILRGLGERDERS
jgi:hypothetical protein